MQQEYLLFLLGFEVSLQDRRTGDIGSDFIVVTSPEEHPEDLEEAHKVIRGHYNRLGYDVKEIKYKESKVKAMDLKEEYKTAQTAESYAG